MSVRQQIPRIVGGAVGVLGLFFVGRLVWTQRSELAATIDRAEPGWLIVALVVGICGLTVIGWSWQALVLHLGGRLGFASALRGYFVGQLGKYVPGGVWAVVGRGEWARRDGVTGPVAYASTILSMVTAYVAGSLMAGMALLMVGELPSSSTGRWIIAGVVLLGPLGLLGLHPRILEWLASWARRLSGRQLALQVLPWHVTAAIVGRQLLAWLGIGTATWLVSIGLGAQLGFQQVLLATCVSWVAGFLFLPVPGGIGIREAAFVAVLGPDPVVATVALVARLVFVLADVAGAGLGTLAVSRVRTAP